MADTRTITLVLDSADKGMGKTLSSVGKDAEDASKKFRSAGQKIKGGLLIASAGIGAFAVSGMNAASDLQETISKAGVVMGSAAGDVLKWSENSATALGQSRQQALDAATGFAVFGKSAGLTGKDLGKFSTDMVGLTSDMASFSNTTPEEAIEAVGAALRGEAEPIRKYGVMLDDATLRQEALKLGLIKTTKQALTPQQKVLAAQAAILNQTKDAQGDFARTANGAANKQRILNAQVQDAKVKLGSGLLPAYNKMLVVGVKATTWASNHTTTVKVLAGVVVGLTATIFAVSAGLKVYNAVQALSAINAKRAAAGQRALNLALIANPIGIVIALVAALVIGIVIAYKKSETFRRIVQGAFNGVKAAGRALWGVLRPVFGFILNYWLTVAGGIVNGAAKAFGWVPGIGPKLKKAAAAFNREAAKIRKSINSIPNSKTFTLKFKADIDNASGWYDPRNHGVKIPKQARASGGRVSAGRPYVVGEHRRELFVPSTSGRIEPYVPTSSGRGWGGGQAPIIIQGDVYGWDDFQAKVRRALSRTKRAGSTTAYAWGG